MRKYSSSTVLFIVHLFFVSSVNSQNVFQSTGNAVLDGTRLTFSSTGISYSGSSSGQIWRDPTFGMVIRSSAGSSYDFLLTDRAGNGVMMVPANMQQALFYGDLGVGATKKLYLDGISDTYISEVGSNTVNFVMGGSEKMRIDGSGNVMIGVTSPATGYKLSVKGNVICEKLKVQLYTAPWPDYVFEKDYKLMPLSELEAFVSKHKHLPGVITDQEVKENGIDIGETQGILLKKIEELTLYIINQNNQVEALKREVEKLRSR